MCESQILGVSSAEMIEGARHVSQANIDSMRRLAQGMNLARMTVNRSPIVVAEGLETALEAQRIADRVDSGLAADLATFTERQGQ